MNKTLIHFFDTYSNMHVPFDSAGNQYIETDACEFIKESVIGLVAIAGIIAVVTLLLFIPVVAMTELVAAIVVGHLTLTIPMFITGFVLLFCFFVTVFVKVFEFFENKPNGPSVFREVYVAKMGKFCKPLTIKAK